MFQKNSGAVARRKREFVNVKSVSVLIVGAILGSCPSFGWTQTAQDSSVVANGTVVISKRPEALRVSVELFAQGKDVRQALAALSDRQQAALNQFKKLGASEEDIQIGEPVLSTDRFTRSVPARLRPNPASIRGPFQSTGTPIPVPDFTTPPASVQSVVSVNVKANLRLDSTDPQSLASVEELKDKIRSLDLADMNRFAPNLGCKTCGSPLGQPTFEFVAGISEDEISVATQEAFGKAKKSAGKLAHAAGAQLGAVRQIEMRDRTAQALRVPSLQSAVAPRLLPIRTEGEVTGSAFGPLTSPVSINVVFALAPAAESEQLAQTTRP